MTLMLARVPAVARLLGGTIGCLACQEPGADWVPAGSGVTNSATASGNTASAVPVTSGSNATATATATVGSSGESTSDSTSGAGGGAGTSTTGMQTDAGGASGTSDSTTETATASQTSNTATSSTTGGSANNLITNGDFSNGEADWSFMGDGSVDVSGGQYCVTLNSDAQLEIGWPDGVDPASVQSGVSYQLSYTAHYTGSAPTLGVKVGQASPPYDPFVEVEAVSIESSAMTFNHDFSMSSDDQAGLLFRVAGVAGASLCLDNVSLIAL